MMLPLSAHCRLHPCFATNDSVHAEMPDDGGTVPEYKGEQCGGLHCLCDGESGNGSGNPCEPELPPVLRAVQEKKKKGAIRHLGDLEVQCLTLSFPRVPK